MNVHTDRGVAKWEIAVIIILLAAGAWLFMPAIDKMQDQAAIAEMRQVSIYIGRTVDSHWGELKRAERQALDLQEALDLVAQQGFILSSNVSIAQPQLLPEGELLLRHKRFEEKTFRFSYSGERAKGSD